MVLLKILFVGALVIIGNYDLHIGDSQERQQFFDLYSEWTGKIFSQGVETTGYVVKFEWLPEVPEEELEGVNLASRKT